MGPSLLFGLLLWLPPLLFELLAPYTLSQFIASPVLRGGFALALLVWLAIVVVVWAIGVRGLRGLARLPGWNQPPAAVAAMAVIAIASPLIVHLKQGVQNWAVEECGLPPELGFALTVVLAAVLALAAVGLSLWRSPLRWMRWIACAWTTAAVGSWAIWMVSRFGITDPWQPKALIAGSIGVALLLVVLGGVAGSKPGRSGHRLSVLAILAFALLIPCAEVLRGDRRAEAPRARSTPPAPDRSSALVLMIDTLRADHTGLQGHDPDTTERLGELAKQRATYFAQTTAGAASTIASVKSFFTAMPPSYPSGDATINSQPPTGAWTMARAFREAGYRTAGLSANGLIDGPGFRNGFDEYLAFDGHKYFHGSFFLNDLMLGMRYVDAFRRMDALHLHKAPASNVTRLAVRWLERHGHEPFFLYLHYVDPHWPYYDRGFGSMPQDLRDLPERYSHVDLMLLDSGNAENASYRSTPQTREMIARYDSEIRYLDDSIGRLLDELGRLGLDESTLVVVVADHGEEFFEHNGFGHGYDVFEEQAHVPLLIRWPAASRFDRMPPRVEAPVSLLDVLPTLADFLGLPGSPTHPFGVSLRPLLEGRSNRQEIGSLTETMVPKHVAKAFRKGSWKVRFVHPLSRSLDQADDVSVYDLDADPGEMAPLPRNHPEVGRFVAEARDEIRRRRSASDGG